MPLPVQHFWTLLLLALVLSGPTGVAAQPAAPLRTAQPRAQPAQPQQPRAQPRWIRLNTLKPVAGKGVVIVGGGLPAGSQVTARLTAPNGSVTQESTRVQDGGRFRLTLALPNAGTYTLVVRGQGFDQTRVLEVQKPKQRPRNAPEAEAPGRSPAAEHPPSANGNRPAQQPPQPNAPAGSGPEK